MFIKLALRWLKEEIEVLSHARDRLLPYNTIIKAHEDDSIAMQAILDRYAEYIRYRLLSDGRLVLGNLWHRSA